MSGKKVYLCFMLASVLGGAIGGCVEWLGGVPTVEALPTLTPSQAPTDTPAVAPANTLPPVTLSPTATITLTPRFSPTPPLSRTATPANSLTATAQALGQIWDRAPVIAYFAAFPPQIDPGQEVLLFWSAEGGSSAAIYRVKADGTSGRTWQVALQGSLSVIPPSSGRDETYVLAVTNGLVTVERSLTIDVSCPYTWFFEPPPEEGCPAGEPVSTSAVTQPFERGRMFWFEAFDQIVVLFSDLPLTGPRPTATADVDEVTEKPAWLIFPDPFQEGDPEDDPSLTVPEGYLQPRRGFGQAWRNMPGLRERLGWAVAGEVNYVAVYQREIIDEGELRLFFSDDLKAVIELVPGGKGWLVVTYLD